jgi:hypothetical protein
MPDFDLGWMRDGDLFIAEIKSTTKHNETKQLRLALGQVLDYADQLVQSGWQVRAVIAVEHEPDMRWVDLCLCHDVTLVWPARYWMLK